MTSDISNLSSLRFTPITLAQMERVEAIRAGSGSTLYVYSFASLFIWQEHEGYGIYISDDAFLVKHGVRGDDVYMFPCGSDDGKRRLIDALMLHSTPVFSYVTDEDRSFLEREYPGRFRFSDCRDDYPYLYDKDEQIALSGKDFKNLRHRVNLGRAVAGTWSSELLSDDNVERALAINRKWAGTRADGDLADTEVADEALRELSRLHLWGVLFQADGEDVAYVAGVFVTPQIFDISFCKVLDKECDCFIKWALYCALPPEVKTVDSEEDMGLAGLRTHKLLRRPKELVRIWKGMPR
ncbi:MAG: DUF2156 domain-containing protein [Clostridia bacterium]|nr:DUF2156 domain-containing protein [Clostridia bacterium]